MNIEKKFDDITVHCIFMDENFKNVNSEKYLGWPIPVHDRIEGAFVKVVEQPESLCFENDMFGLFRIYYWTEGKQIFITDNTDNFLTDEQYSQLEYLPAEKELFEKSLGYTSGDSTFYEKIKKMPPASRLIVDKDGLRVQIMFPFREIERVADKEKHTQTVKQEIFNILSVLKNRTEKIILFYSGGSDSYCLAKTLISLKIPFQPVFMYDISRRAFSDTALKEAKENALKLSMTNLDIFEVDLQDPSLDHVIAKFLRYDRHKAKVHFLALEKITEKYGNRIIIINGQDSDSIFSYGPSEKSFSSSIKRYLMYGKNGFLKFCIAVLCSVYCRRILLLPRNLNELYFSLITNHSYIKLYDLSYSPFSRKFFMEKISLLIKSLKINKNCMEMFLKIFYFIQGPDSQVVVQSAKYFKVSMLIMPFATSETVKSTLMYKDDAFELNHPKYCIRIQNES